MSERRWKVIKKDLEDTGWCSVGDVITLSHDTHDEAPYMKMRDGRVYVLETHQLVEIDANGNTIRTYTEGDTLDGGTLVQREEKMEGLDGVIMDVPMKCSRLNCTLCPLKDYEACEEVLSAEVQRLRDKLAAVHDVWEKAQRFHTVARVVFQDNCGVQWPERVYTRTLPKTIEQEIAEKVVCAIRGMPTNTQLNKLKGIIAGILETEYKARMEVKQ
jgi:hypothetical protein